MIFLKYNIGNLYKSIRMTAWNDFVKKIYHEGHNKDKSYSFKQALKDSSRRKAEMGTSSSSSSMAPPMGKKSRKACMRACKRTCGKSRKHRGKKRSKSSKGFF
jgi:hypothetical protein